MDKKEVVKLNGMEILATGAFEIDEKTNKQMQFIIELCKAFEEEE